MMVETINSNPVSMERVRTFIRYSSAFYNDEKKKVVSKEKMLQKLERIKRLKIDKNVLNELKEIEARLKTATLKESRILETQRKEEILNQELKNKLHVLEAKLASYLAGSSERQKRYKALEEKINTRAMTKAEKIKEINVHINHLEKIYRELQKEKSYPKKKLDSVKNRIDFLKKRLKNLK